MLFLHKNILHFTLSILPPLYFYCAAIMFLCLKNCLSSVFRIPFGAPVGNSSLFTLHSPLFTLHSLKDIAKLLNCFE